MMNQACRALARVGLLAGLGGVFLGDAARAQRVSPAADRLREVVAVANAGDRAGIRGYVSAAFAPAFLGVVPLERHVNVLQRWGDRNGRLEILDVDVATPTEASALVRGALSERWDRVVVEVEPGPPHRVARIGIRPAEPPPGEAEHWTTDEARVTELSRYVRKLAQAGVFSGVVLLARDGEPLYFEAHGVANRDWNVPVTRDTKFNLGSVNKTLTAVAIAQLVERGELSWDDPLSRFLPDFPSPEAAEKVRIEHLLTHTSGLGSYFNRRFVESSRALWRTVDDMMALASPDSLRFEPGTAWHYSNTGYLALGKIIEVVTGQDYFEYIREHIYEPAGMVASDSYELDHAVEKLAVGYEKVYTDDGHRWRNNIFEHVIRGGPAGGGYATALDMLRYSEALRSGKLVSRQTLERMRAPRPELAAPNWGYGFMIRRGGRSWGHGGGFPGIAAEWENLGDSGYTIVILSNLGGATAPIVEKVHRLLDGALAPVAGSRDPT